MDPAQIAGDVAFNFSPPARVDLNAFGSISLDANFSFVSFAAFGTPSPSLVAHTTGGPKCLWAGRRNPHLRIRNSWAKWHDSGFDSGSSALGDPFAGFALESSWALFDSAAPFVSLAGDDIRTGQLSGAINQGFHHTVSLTLAANHVYAVFMLADAAAAAGSTGSTAAANAFIDPVFSFGPGGGSGVLVSF